MTEKKNKRSQEALAAFEELIRIIDTLRSPGGCPWDRKQTSASLKPYFVEETYEVLDAIDSGSASHIKEELGDVLLQIMLHSQIAFENDDFHVGDVIAGLSRKMIERHPHVFADTAVDGEADVLKNWEIIKSSKKSADQGMLHGVPSSLPGLLKAYRIGQKVGRVGFDWPDIASVRAKVTEELAELDEAVAESDKAAQQHELGDVLFAMAQWARHLGLDPEEAMRECCARFESRFGSVEAQVRASEREMSDCSIDELEEFWQQAKRDERAKRAH